MENREFIVRWRKGISGGYSVKVNDTPYGGGSSAERLSFNEIMAGNLKFIKEVLQTESGIRPEEPITSLEIKVKETRSLRSREYVCIFNTIPDRRYDATINNKPFPSKDEKLTFNEIFENRFDFITETLQENAHIRPTENIYRLEVKVVR